MRATYNGKTFDMLNDRDIRFMPNALLLNCLKWHCRSARTIRRGPDLGRLLSQRTAMVKEARRRELDHWTLAHLDPQPCECGKPGLYVVGSDTFCGDCKDVAAAALAQRRAMAIQHGEYRSASIKENKLRAEYRDRCRKLAALRTKRRKR